MSEYKKERIVQLELWECVYNFLKVQGFYINKEFCKVEITTHPDYPALTSVVDFLESGSMVYRAVQADQSQIRKFNYPLLAHIRKPGNEFIHLIQSPEDLILNIDLQNAWSGIVVYPEIGSTWENKQNRIFRKEAKRKRYLLVTSICLLFILFLISTLQYDYLQYNAFGFLSILGLIISILLLGTELGIQSQIVKQVCGAVSGGGCNKVLNSSFAKGYAGITPADLSVIYFAVQLILYSISCWFHIISPIILLFAISGLLVAIWSIYTQSVKLKIFCTLCLSIVGVLLFQFLVSFFLIFQDGLKGNEFDLLFGFTTFAGFSLIMLLFLIPIKKLIISIKNDKIKITELKKWKFDGDLFLKLLNDEQEIDTTVWNKDILIGSNSAPILITIACNPYCTPCAKTHKHLDQILNQFSDKVKLQIRFLFNIDDSNDRRTVAVKAILEKVENIDSDNLNFLLSDWFNFMDFYKWAAKWEGGNSSDVTDKLILHNNWILNSNITHTPTIFINGRKLNGKYTLDDFVLLIPQLADIYESKLAFQKELE